MLRVLVGSLMCIGLVNNCYSLLSVSDAMDAKKQSTNTGFQSLCDDYIKLIQAHNNLHNRLSGAQGINGTATPLEGKAMKEIAAWDAACTSFTGPLATVTAPYVPQAHTQIINDIYLHAWTEYQRAGAGSAVANASGSQALPFPKSSTQPTISLSAPKPPPPPSGKNGLGTANLNVKTLPAPVSSSTRIPPPPPPAKKSPPPPPPSGSQALPLTQPGQGVSSPQAGANSIFDEINALRDNPMANLRKVTTQPKTKPLTAGSSHQDAIKAALAKRNKATQGQSLDSDDDWNEPVNKKFTRPVRVNSSPKSVEAAPLVGQPTEPSQVNQIAQPAGASQGTIENPVFDLLDPCNAPDNIKIISQKKKLTQTELNELKAFTATLPLGIGEKTPEGKTLSDYALKGKGASLRAAITGLRH